MSSATAPTASLIPRRNGLNVVRLALALSVVVAHAWMLAGKPGGPAIAGHSIGGLAVAAFFCISGYLITKSRVCASTGRYFWHRLLRIFPGLWVVLIVTGLVLAPLRWLITEGALTGFPWGSAVAYFPANATLLFGAVDIDGTLDGAALQDWNKSIWTLLYEFACYVAVAVFASLGWLRRRWPVVAVTAAIALTGLVTGQLPGGNTQLGALNIGLMLGFFALFGAGMIVALYEDRLRLTARVAGPCLLVVVGGLYLFDSPLPLVALPLTYFLLWLGVVIPAGPLHRVDLSYGVYIYGYPVQQVIAATPAGQHGVALYLLATIPVVLALAWASWMLVESRALRLKDWSPFARPRDTVRATR